MPSYGLSIGLSVNDINLEDYLPLVRGIANKVVRKCSGNLDVNDLIGYGVVALYEKANLYNPNMGAQFGTFIYYKIWSEMMSQVRRQGWSKRSSVVSVELDNDVIELAKDTTDSVEIMCNNKLMLDRISSGFDLLSQKQLYLIRLYYGKGMSLRKIAQLIKRSPTNINNIIREAIDILRNNYNEVDNEQRM